MNPTRHKIPDVNSPANKLASKLMMVKDAIRRAEDNLGDGQMSPASCAYIDGQLAKAIGWLASARAIAITLGSLDHPHFDGDELIDLDDPRGQVERFEDATQAEGGAS